MRLFSYTITHPWNIIPFLFVIIDEIQSWRIPMKHSLYLSRVIPAFLSVIFLFFTVHAAAEPSYKETTEKALEIIRKLVLTDPDDTIVSCDFSRDVSFAGVVTRSGSKPGLTFYVLENENNTGWKIQAFNHDTMLREYDPDVPPQVIISQYDPEVPMDYEIFILYDTHHLAGWEEGITVRKEQGRWNATEYFFFDFDKCSYSLFVLYIISDPIDPENNCLATLSHCFKTCYMDISIDSFDRTRLREEIEAMFDTDAIDAWEQRNTDIENYRNYYEWVLEH